MISIIVIFINLTLVLIAAGLSINNIDHPIIYTIIALLMLANTYIGMALILTFGWH